MEALFALYEEMHNSAIYLFDFRGKAATVKMGDQYGIFFDTMVSRTIAEEKEIIAHELGHCKTGTTHSISSPFELIERHEYRADKWAIHELIPFEDLQKAIKEGNTEIWQLAEYFNETEDFIRRTEYVYQCEGRLFEG